jgi:hypothetical protein
LYYDLFGDLKLLVSVIWGFLIVIS